MKYIIGLLFVFSAFLVGCSLLENVGGFDLTGCERDWYVCAELGWDNMDKIETPAVNGGILVFCFFCGAETRGENIKQCEQIARDNNWDRYCHNDYYDGERWVCKECSTRHRVFKKKKRED